MVQIDCFDITQLGLQDFQILYYLASPERKNRTDRYHRREDKLRCIAADALLRRAARQTSGRSDFSVLQEADGKPYVVEMPDFHYNISHSGRWVVIAYGSSPVGIDVQSIRDNVSGDALARRWFTPEEQADLLSTPEDSRRQRFFEIWTGKESYLKYLGTGLRKGLDSFSVLPDSAPPEVSFYCTLRDDHCLTLCSREANHCLTQLNLRQLIS
jgi:4'-phosphopantetheinyl transferase